MTALDRLSGAYYNSNPVSVANPGGFDNDGHETNFFAAINDVAEVAADTIAQTAATEASAVAARDLAAGYAATALNAPGTQATSVTSLIIGKGLRYPAIQAGKFLVKGMFLLLVSRANKLNFMIGQVESYSGTALVVDIQKIGGSGTFDDWDISLTAAPSDDVAALQSDLSRVMLRLAELNANQFGTPNGAADTFDDLDGVDTAGATGHYNDAASKLFVNQQLDPTAAWSAKSAGAGSFQAVAFEPSGVKGIAVGALGVAWVTLNSGVTWTAVGSLGTATFNAVCWGNGQFLLIGNAVAYTSSDLATFTLRAGFTQTGRGAVWALGLFVAACAAGIYTSPDGVTWTQRLATAVEVRAVAFNGSNQLCAVGDNNGTSASVWVSADALAWVSRAFVASSRIYLCVAWGNGVWFAGGQIGVTMTSTDNGATFTETSSGTGANGFTAVYFAYNRFVFASNASKLWVTTDRVTYTSVTLAGSFSFAGICAVANRACVVGNTGSLFTLELSTTAMSIPSVAYTAGAAPTKASLTIVAKGASAITPGTHLRGWVARDGVNYVEIPILARETVGGWTYFDFMGANITSAPTGTAMKWKVTTTNGFRIEVTAVVFNWGN